MAFSYPKSRRGKSALLLEDGSLYPGFGVGACGGAIGELCFNTSMSGYQEVLSDPSYAEQIIVFSFPHIGNVGACLADDESDQVHARGCIFAQKPSESSSWRSEFNFDDWLAIRSVIGLYGLDTRSLVRRLRDCGALRAAIINEEEVFFSKKVWLKKIQDWSGLLGAELARGVGIKKEYQWLEKTTSSTPSSKASSKAFSRRSQPQTSEESKEGEELLGASLNDVKNELQVENQSNEQDGSKSATSKRDKQLHIVAVDFGIKRNILRCLSKTGALVTVVPPTSSKDKILELDPDGIFLSNGPGDPAASARYADNMLKPLLTSNIPIFGICLGFQLLSLAFGARSEKMAFGHHGTNHPVQELQTGRVEITSQNHSFMVSRASLPAELEATHISLFDQSLEGFNAKHRPIFAVQYHPEASPGPHDAGYLFNRFFNDCRKYSATKTSSHK